MAFNLDTLDGDLYTDSLFNNANHEILLYCFEMLFPSVTFILAVFYGVSSRKAIEKYVKKHANDINSWAAAIAHAVISLTFIVCVVLLDILALVFRDQTPEYYSTSYNERLFHFPGLVILWDTLALLLFIIFIIVASIQDQKSGKQLLCLIFAGVTPLLCLASHAIYIVVAWLTNTLFAAGIGLYYGICYILHLLVFKQVYKGVKSEDVKFNSKALCAVLGAWVVTVSFQALITVFVVIIPINNATESTSRLFIILQSVGALVLGLIAYKFIVNQKGMAVVSGALRNMLRESKAPEEQHIYTAKQWENLDDEEKLAVFLYNVMNKGGDRGGKHD